MKCPMLSGGPIGATDRMRSRWDRRYAGVLVAFALFALPACAPKAAPTTAKSAPQPVVVTVAQVKPVELRRTVSGVGTLYANEDVMLSPKVDGRVLRVLKNEGDTAYPGEVLMELDPTDARLAIGQAQPALQAELRKLKLEALPESDAVFTAHLPNVDSVAQAKANQELAEKEFVRIEEEVRRGVGSVQGLDSARTKSKVAKTAVDLAETEARVTLAQARRLSSALDDAEDRLRETQLRVPVPDDWAAWSAIVGPAANPVRYSVAARMVHKGATISPMRVTNAFRLVTDHVLKLRVAVPERYSPDVHVGQKVEVRVEAYPNLVFPGTVARMFPTVDPENRTFVTEVEVPNCCRKLKCGGFANAEVLVRTDAAVLTVPQEAVVTFAGVTKVYVVEGETVKAVEVEVGAREKDWVEIRGAISATAKVVTSGQTQLVDGSPIRVR
ncbi:MAG: efflux RND transporter periplasmic adaptor subunit [Planctomycetes bacterium]|nr:efflux RND transporter periplasmic adaptor subunit [Planctomycetota bacterium]